jgi:site-specific DNA-methyltransferase (adenine-specific)
MNIINENIKESELLNKKNKIDGLKLLSLISNDVIKATFFDPQYRGLLDKINYGNHKREVRRKNLPQMSEQIIINFIKEIDRVLMPSGHLFLWIDKFQLTEGYQHWLNNTNLNIVDLIVWEKHKIGMGYRSRNKCEFLLILQKTPKRVKGIWTIHNIPNVWKEKVETKEHPHSKPIELQTRLIEAISNENDFILDPAMGSGSVLTACIQIKRNFIGGDIND